MDDSGSIDLGEFHAVWRALPGFLRSKLSAESAQRHMRACFRAAHTEASSPRLMLADVVDVCKRHAKQPPHGALSSHSPCSSQSPSRSAPRSGLAALRALHGSPCMDASLLARLGLSSLLGADLDATKAVRGVDALTAGADLASGRPCAHVSLSAEGQEFGVSTSRRIDP